MNDNILSWLTDRIILRPTTHPIHAAGTRRVLPFQDGELELWTHERGEEASTDPDLYVLDFPGTASRAERPADYLDGLWPGANVQLWSVNPPGYGGSSGRASLRNFPTIAGHALDALEGVAQGRPIVAAGSSLGTVSALHLAARRNVSGVLLQNPPDLRKAILHRGGAWPLRWAANALARQIDDALCSIENAARATAPAVFVVALQDVTVPTVIQQQIVEAYAGPKQVLELPDADHDTKLSESDMHQLEKLKGWLCERIFA